MPQGFQGESGQARQSLTRPKKDCACFSSVGFRELLSCMPRFSSIQAKKRYFILFSKTDVGLCSLP